MLAEELLSAMLPFKPEEFWIVVTSDLRSWLKKEKIDLDKMTMKNYLEYLEEANKK